MAAAGSTVGGAWDGTSSSWMPSVVMVTARGDTVLSCAETGLDVATDGSGWAGAALEGVAGTHRDLRGKEESA